MTEEQQPEEQQDQQEQQPAGQDVRPAQESEVPEGHEADDSNAEKYPGAPRPGMIPNQAAEGQAPSVSISPTPSGGGTADSGTEAGASGGGEPASAPPATGPAGGPSGGGGESA